MTSCSLKFRKNSNYLFVKFRNQGPYKNNVHVSVYSRMNGKLGEILRNVVKFDFYLYRW